MIFLPFIINIYKKINTQYKKNYSAKKVNKKIPIHYCSFFFFETCSRVLPKYVAQTLVLYTCAFLSYQNPNLLFYFCLTITPLSNKVVPALASILYTFCMPSVNSFCSKTLYSSILPVWVFKHKTPSPMVISPIFLSP